MATGNRYPKWGNPKYDETGSQQYERKSWRNGTGTFQGEPRKFTRKYRPPYHPADPSGGTEAHAVPSHFAPKPYPLWEGKSAPHVLFYSPHT